jgi:hypothetical protein
MQQTLRDEDSQSRSTLSAVEQFNDATNAHDVDRMNGVDDPGLCLR